MKKQISTLWGTIIIVLAAIVFFGGALIYQYFVIKEFNRSVLIVGILPATQKNQEINNAQPSTQTAGWKTYTNTEYGFEIQYPNTFIGSVSEKAKTSGVFFYGKNSDNLTLEGFLNTQFNPGNLVSNSKDVAFGKSEILVDGIKSYEVDSTTCYMGCGSSYSVFVPYKNGAIVIGIGRGDGSQQTPDLVKITDKEKANFNQILFTFKFTK